MTVASHGRWAAHARLADELVVPERARDQIEEPRADQGLLLAEEASPASLTALTRSS